MVCTHSKYVIDSYNNSRFIKMTNIIITADTPLSALFRRTFHEELRQVINTWRPYLINDDKTKDALELCRFDFDKKCLTARRVYWDLVELIECGALRPSLQTLADYLFDHSNLSRTASTLYQLLALARREWERIENR